MEWGRGNGPTCGDPDIGLGVHRSLRGPSDPPGHGAEPREWDGSSVLPPPRLQEPKLEELAVLWGHKESPVQAQMWKLAFPSLVEVSAAAARCTIDFPWTVTRWPSASPRDLRSGCERCGLLLRCFEGGCCICNFSVSGFFFFFFQHVNLNVCLLCESRAVALNGSTDAVVM